MRRRVMLQTLFVLFYVVSNAVAKSHAPTLVGSEDAVQCDMEDRGTCVQEASISLLQSKVEVVKSSDTLSTNQPEPGSLVWDAYEKVADEARAKLVAGSVHGAKPMNPTGVGAVFSAVDVSLPVDPPVLHRLIQDVAPGRVLEDKNIMPLGVKPPCLVYGLGVASAASNERPDFEVDMALRGCEVHAFDCSVRVDDPNVVNRGFNFHPWCIGKEDSAPILEDSTYVKVGKVENPDALVFKSLGDSMSELGHSHLDLLKFDIEGFEWPLFEDELLGKNSDVKLPIQMSFELHTEGANDRFVQPEVVAGKKFAQVNRLFLRLFDLGYRVVSKEINMFDNHCAEFVIVNIKATKA